MDEVEILYNGKKVDQNLIIYKGTFFNSGNSDIDNTLIYEPLKLKLPKDYEWRKVVIIDKSKDVNVEIQNNTNEITFIWDILKENEFFIFDSVVEYKPRLSKKSISNDLYKDVSANLSENVKIYCTINNLKSIEKEKLPRKPLSFGDSLMTHLSFLFLTSVGILLYLLSAQIIDPQYDILHEIVFDSKHNYYKIESIYKNEVQLTDSLGNRLEYFNIDILNRNHLTGKIKLHKEDTSIIMEICGIIFSAIFIVMYIWSENELIKSKRLYRKVKIISDKYT